MCFVFYADTIQIEKDRAHMLPTVALEYPFSILKCPIYISAISGSSGNSLLKESSGNTHYLLRR